MHKLHPDEQADCASDFNIELFFLDSKNNVVSDFKRENGNNWLF